MKKLFLLRHAKSSWKNPNLEDFDRPLNRRGIKDAPVMAARFKERNVELDLIISSSSKRTTETAEIFANVLNYNKDITYIDKLYLASSGTILQIVNQINENNIKAMIVCHNPGITNLANFLGDIFIDNIPTTGIVGFSFNNSWLDMKGNSCKRLFIDYPKKQ
ncbi:MAG: histidine phosphatase family protein [Ignavibacteriales bacterium]|nr:histidine phosphatase family protein [Ignavibacteriales bacterium]